MIKDLTIIRLQILNCRYARPKSWIFAFLFITGILILSPSRSTAQISLMGGVNATSMLNQQTLKNAKAYAGFHAGWSFRVYPVSSLPSFSIQNQILYSGKGYRQELDSVYIFRLHYLTFPVLLNYDLHKDFSVNAGIEPGVMFGFNLADMNRLATMYKSWDLGIMIGFTCFDHRRISGYAELTYGLLPLVDYYIFDRYGNFTSEIRDLRNMCISFGLKLNFSHEKIHLY